MPSQRNLTLKSHEGKDSWDLHTLVQTSFWVLFLFKGNFQIHHMSEFGISVLLSESQDVSHQFYKYIWRSENLKLRKFKILFKRNFSIRIKIL